MKLVLFAYHDIGCAALRALHDMGENILAVFTHADDPKENVWFGSVERLADELEIPNYCPENPNTPQWISTLKAVQPDALFSFYYRSLLCQEILDIPTKGSYNLHGSLLPKFRGRAPVNWALIKGEKETGVTLHKMVTKADAGEILAQKKIGILEEDTALTLFKKLVPLTEELLLETVPLIAQGKIIPKPQDPTQATKFGGRKPEDGKINWNSSSQEIYNLIRAVTHPYPGAFTFFKGKKILVWWGRNHAPNLNPQAIENPGTIFSLEPCLISCGKGILRLEKVQTEGDGELLIQDWIKKYNIEPGTKIGD